MPTEDRWEKRHAGCRVGRGNPVRRCAQRRSCGRERDEEIAAQKTVGSDVYFGGSADIGRRRSYGLSAGAAVHRNFTVGQSSRTVLGTSRNDARKKSRGIRSWKKNIGDYQGADVYWNYLINPFDLQSVNVLFGIARLIHLLVRLEISEEETMTISFAFINNTNINSVDLNLKKYVYRAKSDPIFSILESSIQKFRLFRKIH